MNIRDLGIDPAHFSVKITNFLVHNNNDVFADYEIEVRYEVEEQEAKVWHLQRGFTEFECLHGLLIKKYDKAPFLPCRVILPLRNEERKERVKLLETYLSICVKAHEILNSLELRLFLEIEKHSGIFVNPLICVKEIQIDEFTPVAHSFWPSNRLIIIATSINPNVDSTTIQKVFSTFKGLFGRSQKLYGRLQIMREKVNRGLNFEVFSSEEFADFAPLCMSASETLSMVSVGFENGKIINYHVDKALRLTKFTIFESHKQPVRCLCSLDSAGLLMSSAEDKSMTANDLSDEHGYFHEESNFLYPASAFMFVQKLSILFVGDTNGNMHIYKFSNEFKGRRFNLLLTRNISDSKITSFATDSKETFIFVSFADGIVQALQTGPSFEGMPKLVASWNFSECVSKIYYSNKTKTFIAIHGNGLVSFCDILNPPNFYTQILHNLRITDFTINEAERTLITISEDKRLKLYVYEENLFSDKFPEKDRIKEFDQSQIANFIVPDSLTFEESKQTIPFKATDTPKIEEKAGVRKMSNSGSEEDDNDDMIGWDS
jgi:hypothetical protein